VSLGFHVYKEDHLCYYTADFTGRVKWGPPSSPPSRLEASWSKGSRTWPGGLHFSCLVLCGSSGRSSTASGGTWRPSTRCPRAC